MSQPRTTPGELTASSAAAATADQRGRRLRGRRRGDWGMVGASIVVVLVSCEAARARHVPEHALTVLPLPPRRPGSKVPTRPPSGTTYRKQPH
ncbi:MAG TPA: hypothetical protein VFK43_18010, partial [Acidimicrobiales bacterium]|nr:hypothetical protein [Acidimicrobiales bacterium]